LSVLKTLAPTRSRDIVGTCFYALFGGCIVSFITACLAGVFSAIKYANFCSKKNAEKVSVIFQKNFFNIVKKLSLMTNIWNIFFLISQAFSSQSQPCASRCPTMT
jgi:phosphotransferase system  glucose/maltose/N-acetylglucosamine-specific IIC component